MSSFRIDDTVGAVVTRRPALSRVFEKMGIDYCCGGKKTLDEACRKKGLAPEALLVALEESLSSEDAPAVDAAAMSVTELVDHIEQTHHVYLRSEFPRLDGLTDKVAKVHGKKEPRLLRVRETFTALVEELSGHMQKEEKVLFPMVRQLDAAATAPGFHCGSIANPIRQMELEHDQAGAALGQLSELTDGYTPPDWACNTYRAMLDGLARLEDDLHQHIHKENNVLFPRVLEMQERKLD